MESATLGAPVQRKKLVPNGPLAMSVFVFTEVMLFAGLISAHVVVRDGAGAGGVWPPFGQPRLPVGETVFNSMALFASGLALLLVQLEWRRRGDGKHPLVSVLLAGAAVTGALFVGLQGREWAALIAEGLTLTSSNYGAFFYLIVGAHGLHALAAIVALTWSWFRLRANKLRSDQLASVAIFQYFVVLVWPILYWRVYL